MTEKTIKDGAINPGKDEISIFTHFNTYLRQRTSTTVAGLSLRLAFTLAGVILGLAVQI